MASNYKQLFYVKWSSLQQGKRMVANFMREFEKLCLDCDIGENHDLKLGRFMAGWNIDLRARMTMGQGKVRYSSSWVKINPPQLGKWGSGG